MTPSSKTQNDDVIRNLASREIHSAMRPKTDDETRSVIAPSNRVLSPKGQEHYIVRYRHEYSKFVESSKIELQNIHRDYQREYVARDVSFQERMWRAALVLHKIITSEEIGWSECRRRKFLVDLHDYFYQMESKRCLSRSNFDCCLKKSFGTAVNKVHIHFDALFNPFDALCKESINWRSFLFYLHFAFIPTTSCEKQIVKAFSVIASDDDIDPTLTSSKAMLDLKDMGVILYPLVKASCIQEVLCVVDDAWAEVVSSRYDLETSMASTKVSIVMLKQMLEQECMKSLFQPSTLTWGKGRMYPVFVCKWEESFYTDTLLSLVKESRRDVAIANKLIRDDITKKQALWREWVSFALYQRSLRLKINTINRRMEDKLLARGLRAFSYWSVRQMSALLIQRVSRGFMGRVIATWHWFIYNSATMIQCRIRIYLSMKRYKELSSRYHSAILTVQTSIRGALGRRMALKRLMSFVESEHQKNRSEKSRLLMLRGIWGTTKLQSGFRRKQARLLAQERRELRARESDVCNAMEAQSESFRKERRIYERQLEEFYRLKREEYHRNTQIQSKLERDKVSVRTLRRRLKNEELQNVPPDNTEQNLTEEWLKNWETRIEKGVEDIKVHTRHCITKPDNSVEKKTGNMVKKRIKARTAEVLARADTRGIPLETKEGKKIATEEMIHIIGEEERTKLQSDMNAAFVEREQEKEEARWRAKMKKKDEKARATIHAASIVTKACRIWRARKELRRLCLETYEKEYDEINHMFYYRNKKTSEVTWTKPKAMGFNEMPTKDEWKVLRDAHDFPYYFNPKLVQMRYNPPANQDMCCGTVCHTWWREYPVRVGPCPYFATQLNESDGMRYCEECYR